MTVFHFLLYILSLSTCGIHGQYVANIGNSSTIPETCDQSVVSNRQNATIKFGIQSALRLDVGLGVFVIVGIIVAMVAVTFHLIRRIVYKDHNSLDTTFDAGGNVSLGMTASTIVSQWLWSAMLLQSSTVAAKYGISGTYWYSAGVAVQVILFCILCIEFKIRAPGAKTFLQVMKVRFGKATHIVFCIFGLANNLVIIMLLVLGSCEVLSSLIDGLSQELAVMLICGIIALYTLIGGIGATYYVFYLNTVAMFVVVLVLLSEVYYNPYDDPENVFGSMENVYKFITCLKAPEGNVDNSYLTLISFGGISFSLINFIGNMSIIVADQSCWQTSIASSPVQVVWGFILGAFGFFILLLTLSTTTGLAYLGLASYQGQDLVSEDEMNRGLIAPVVFQLILDVFGEYSMIFYIIISMLACGSAEIMGVSSVIVYDIYQTYIQPFRKNHKEGECILCGKLYLGSVEENICKCHSMSTCNACHLDTIVKNQCKELVKPHYKCNLHSKYREYLDQLLSYRNWCILSVTVAVIPLFLFCYAVKLNVNWAYLFMGVLVASTVFPITFSVMWPRATSLGMIVGCVGGCTAGVITWLAYASTYPDGLSSFLENTARERPMLAGNAASLIVGGVLCIITSIAGKKRMTSEEIEKEWEKTQSIDNPLKPWPLAFKDILNFSPEYSEQRPPLKVVLKAFKKARITAYSSAVVSILVLLVIWPGIIMGSGTMNLSAFSSWILASLILTVIAGFIILISPVLQEVLAILKQIKINKKEASIEEMNRVNGQKEKSFEGTYKVNGENEGAMHLNNL